MRWCSLPNSFRFSADAHEYFDGLNLVPGITGMLVKCGLIDDTWFTEESRIRGTAVHHLTAAYDLGALNLEAVAPVYRPYLLAHVAAMEQLRPSWTDVEVAYVHPHYRFGGRPDRVGACLRLQTVCEIKSGAPHKSHRVQLALQAILVAQASDLKDPFAWRRMAVYLRPNGRFKVEIHRDGRDFDQAHEVIQECCA